MDSSHIPSTSPPLATENSLAYPDTGYSCISVANNAPVKKGRKQPERYLFSKEITVHHRKEKAYNGKFIVKSFFRDFPTKAQLRKNPSRFGNRISKVFSSSSLASDDEIVPYLESLVWSDKHLRPIICEALKKKFGKTPVSFKTAWYMKIDDINAIKGYKPDVCTVFFSLVTDKDAFFNLVPGVSSKSEAETALKEFCKQHGYKKTKEHELLYQLRIIWDAVCKEENPFREMLAVRDAKHDRYGDMRQSTTLKSLSNERLATLNDFLQNKNDLSFSALIAIKNRLGLSAGVIGALTWGDYVTVPYVGIHALQISKQFGESGTEPELLSDPDKNRLISLDSKTDKIFRSYYTQEQAIQGIAVVNGVHTTHSFSRYFYDGGWYKHVCFYCDTVDAWPYPLSGSSQFVYASSCAHDYEKMVSLGDKIWMKCTRCYKVVTHYHSFNDSYVSAGYHSHYAYCECGDYLSQSHNMVSNICTACGFSHTHTYDGWTYYNSTTHIESCCCGRTGTATAVHSIKASEVVDNKANCLGCGYMLDLRYDVAVSIPDSVMKVSVNGSYILPSGIIVLVDEDVEAYLNGTLVFYDKDDLPVTQ